VVCLPGWSAFSIAIGTLLASADFPSYQKLAGKFLFSLFLDWELRSILSMVAFSMLVVFGCPGLMFGFVCVEGKSFEFFGGGEGAFPFRVTKFNRRKRFSVTLSLEEFRPLTVEWVRFCSSKGDSLWMKTLNGTRGVGHSS